LIGACALLLIAVFSLWRAGGNTRPYMRLSWYAAGAASIFVLWATFVAMPEQLRERKGPGDFLRQQQSQVTADTLLVADRRIFHAVNWVFKRDDAYLLNPGELTYGLSYPDANYRDLRGDAFGAFLESYAGKRPIAIFVRDRHREFRLGRRLPPQAHFEQFGTFGFWHIPAGQTTP
jgi:4-amino-4-deoxy-L-arabinose transferase